MKNHISIYENNQVFLVNQTSFSQSGISKMIRSGRDISVYLKDNGDVQCIEETKLLFGSLPTDTDSKAKLAKSNNPTK